MNPQSFLNNTLVIPFSIVKLSYVGGLRILWDVIDWYYWEPPRSLKNKESCHIIMPFNCEIYHSTPFWALKKTICILFNYVVIPNTFHTKRLFQNVVSSQKKDWDKITYSFFPLFKYTPNITIEIIKSFVYGKIEARTW